jgi:hypothetical protein
MESRQALEIIEYDQKCIQRAEREVIKLKGMALSQFNNVKDALSDTALAYLAGTCGVEGEPEHCVACAAYAEHVRRIG